MKKRFLSLALTLLFCLALLPGNAAAAGASGFSDVRQNDWYYNAVNWAVEKGITTGTSTSAFSPDDTCSVAQVVTFLWRAAGEPETTIANSFSMSSSNYNDAYGLYCGPEPAPYAHPYF